MVHRAGERRPESLKPPQRGAARRALFSFGSAFRRPDLSQNSGPAGRGGFCTAALDAQTELEVLQNLAEWGEGRAIFLITHRLSTIRRADRIAYLKDGRIIETGSHDELVAREEGAYRKLVEAEDSGPALAAGS